MRNWYKPEIVPTINLDGPEGDSETLIHFARKMARQLGMESERVVIEMTRSDYRHLVRTFDWHFGDIISLETENPDLLESCAEAS